MTYGGHTWIALGALVACSGGGPDPARLQGGALAVAGDYAGNGIASRVDIDGLHVQQNVVAGVVGGDPAARLIDERIFVIDRFGGDSVTVLDSELSLLAQASTGGGSNPQDVAAIGDFAYVAALDAPGVLVIDLKKPEAGVMETIDLAGLDPDGVPDCGSIVARAGTLYVACSLFDRGGFPWAPRGRGVVVAIDPATHGFETTELEHENPFGWMHLSVDVLYVATAPDPFEDLERGCLETVRLPELAPDGCLVDNGTLGGYAAAIAGGEDELWVAVATTATTGELARYDGTWSTIDLGDGANPTDLSRCSRGDLLVADNARGSRGVRVFPPTGGRERTSEPLDVGWPTVFTPTHSIVCP